jgi:hypothetical protein
MKRFVTALGMCALLAGTVALAGTETWNGASGFDFYWTTGTNWVSGSAPVSTDDAIVGYNTNGWPELSQDETIANLTMRDGSSGGSETRIFTEDTFTSTPWTLTITDTFSIEDTDSGSYVAHVER